MSGFGDKLHILLADLCSKRGRSVPRASKSILKLVITNCDPPKFLGPNDEDRHDEAVKINRRRSDGQKQSERGQLLVVTTRMHVFKL